MPCQVKFQVESASNVISTKHRYSDNRCAGLGLWAGIQGETLLAGCIDEDVLSNEMPGIEGLEFSVWKVESSEKNVTLWIQLVQTAKVG